MAALHKYEITTDASGDWTATIDIGRGYLLQYRYVPDGTSPLDTGADLDITGAQSGFVYVNQDNIGTSAYQKVPRLATCDETGTASLYAAAGEPVEAAAFIAEPLKATIAQGGNAKKGSLYVWIG